MTIGRKTPAVMKQLTCDEVRELLPAYALDALSDAERPLVEAAIPGCEGCAELLVEYQSVATGLLQVAPVSLPPPALRASLLLQAGVTRLTTISKPAHSRGILQSLVDWLSGAASTPRWSLAAAAVIAVVGFGLLGNQLSNLSSQARALADQAASQQDLARQLQTRLDTQSATLRQMEGQLVADRRIVQVAADGAARTVLIANKQLPPTSTVYLRFSDNNQAAVLSVANLPQLSDQQTYQLWLFDATGKPIPSALFSQVATAVLVEAPSALGSYKNFAVSIEPRAGSNSPTGPVVAVAY